MDPYSAEGELINIHNHFHQGQFQEVVDFDTSALSAENALPARVLALRAKIGLGEAEDVLTDIKGEKEPELVAIGGLAEFTLGKTDAAVKTIEKVAASNGDNPTVQIIGGTVLQAAGKAEDALALLSQHQGSRMSVSIQISKFPNFQIFYFYFIFVANLIYSRRRRPNSPNPPTTESE
jgi:coatomer subunit epsilon